MSNSELIPMLKEQRNKVTLTVVSWPGSLVWKLKRNTQHLQVPVGHPAKLKTWQTKGLLNSCAAVNCHGRLLVSCLLKTCHYCAEVINKSGGWFKATVNLNSCCGFLGSLKLFRVVMQGKLFFLCFSTNLLWGALLHFRALLSLQDYDQVKTGTTAQFPLLM